MQMFQNNGNVQISKLNAKCNVPKVHKLDLQPPSDTTAFSMDQITEGSH